MSNIFGVANYHPEKRTYERAEARGYASLLDSSAGYRGDAGVRDHRFLPHNAPPTEQQKIGCAPTRIEDDLTGQFTRDAGVQVTDCGLRIPSTKGAARLAPQEALVAANRTGALQLGGGRHFPRGSCPMTQFEHHCFLSGAKKNDAWFTTSSKMEFASVPTGGRSVGQR